MSEPIDRNELMDLDQETRIDEGISSAQQLANQDQEDDSDPIRHEALKLSGVDELSSRDIKRYLDYYLKDSVISNDQRINTFFLQWVDDSSVNVVFEDAESSSKALVILTDNYDDVTNLSATHERRAKPYIHEEALIKSADEDQQPEEKKDINLSIRIALKADKKEKNAKDKSRYYLLHGEPDRRQRPRIPRGPRGGANNYRGRSTYNRRRDIDDDEPDLLADKIPGLNRDEPSNIDEAFSSNGNGIRDSARGEDDGDRWKSDKFDDRNDDDDLFPGFKPRTDRSRSPSRSRSPRRDRSRSPARERSRSPFRENGGSLLDRITPNKGSRKRRGRRQRAHNLFE